MIFVNYLPGRPHPLLARTRFGTRARGFRDPHTRLPQPAERTNHVQ
jgi:hypothetical protein